MSYPCKVYEQIVGFCDAVERMQSFLGTLQDKQEIKMELQDYTTDELRAEIKRRNALKKDAQKHEARCRNCKFLMNHPHVKGMYLRGARTWGKTYQRHYSVKLYTKACNEFKNKFE